VKRATGVHPQLPAHLANLLSRRERYDVLPKDLGRIQQYVLAHRRSGSGN
jgi:threonine synthase